MCVDRLREPGRQHSEHPVIARRRAEFRSRCIRCGRSERVVDARLQDVVTTGARALALRQHLAAIGIATARSGPPAPRLNALAPGTAADVLDLYRTLGGTQNEPALRPGSWDLACADGLVIELDEELHFNRYRAVTLGAPWAAATPWTAEYLELCREEESACLAAATWGKRWTNPSCERLFGPGDPPGNLGQGGAPRWKQRALYDAMKDAAAADSSDIRLARLATHDDLDGVTLGAVLEGRAEPNLDALEQLVVRRTTGPDAK